ncbi:MAG: class I SAM-dependent methyltransferase [Rhodospirillaceae bacterium]
MHKFATACAMLLILAGAAPLDHAARAAEDGYRNTPLTLEGIGKSYMGRDIPYIMGHEGADWLERRERAEEEGTARLIPMLKLKPTDVVADIGAGTGYFTFRLAGEVPEGKVYAVDVQPEMLDRIRARIKTDKTRNVEPVHGSIASPRLPSNTVDLMLLVDAYHEFALPREMATAMVWSLKPGGRLALVEYRGEDQNVPIKSLHKMTVEQARRELEPLGLKFVSVNSTALPWQHLMIFEKPRPE